MSLRAALFCLALVGACQPDRREADDAVPAAADGVQETTAIQEPSSCTSPEPAEAVGTRVISVYFADFRAALGESPTPAGFLPGGVMADITWTVFQQFPEVQALRFAFDGSEREFWSRVAGEPTAPQLFTREDWERV